MSSSGSRRVVHILDALWYGCSALETLMVLLALLALSMGVAGVFPQQPPGVQGAAAERWLASAASSYPGAGPVLRWAGIFDVFESPWLRLLLAALFFNIALRLAIQSSALARLLRGRDGPSAPAESAVDNAQSALRTIVGPLSAYAGTLLLLAGLFLNSTAAWRASQIALAPGSSSRLGGTGTLQLSLEDLAGSEQHPIARISVSNGKDGQPIGTGQVTFGNPMRQGGYWIALRSAGQALQAEARDSRGQPLLLQPLEAEGTGTLAQGDSSKAIHLLFRQTQAEQEFALPSANLSFRVVSYPSLPEQGIETPVFLVEAYQGNGSSPVASELVVDRGSLRLNDATLNLLRDRYAVVDVAYLPGLIPYSLGGLAILAGVILALWARTPLKAGAGGQEAPSSASTGSGQSETGLEPKHAP
jgi:hypothetical protein